VAAACIEALFAREPAQDGEADRAHVGALVIVRGLRRLGGG
jgi:hypothetical protein